MSRQSHRPCHLLICKAVLRRERRAGSGKEDSSKQTHLRLDDTGVNLTDPIEGEGSDGSEEGEESDDSEDSEDSDEESSSVVATGIGEVQLTN